MSNNEAKQTFWEHLDVLRGALIKIIVVAVLFGVLAFCFKETLFEIVLAPKYSDFITYDVINRISSLVGSPVSEVSIQLINTSLSQQFIIHMKTALYTGVLCVSPYILYQFMRFISPALYEDERSHVYKVVGFGYMMFIGGVLLSYFLIFPLTFRFLGTYQVSGDVANMISLESYVSTLMGLSLIMGLVFELPIICWLLAKLGVLTADFMKNYRKHAVVLILAIAAIITPSSDIFTLSLVSFPIWFLYEISIIVVGKISKEDGI